MQIPVLSSTALLTILMSMLAALFIRASTKDRIQVAKLVTPQQGEPLLEQIQQYFTQRAYRIAGVDAVKNQVTYEGLVRPSIFLAIFLTLLAAIGLLCLALMLSFSWRDATPFLPGLVVFAPLAGIFYWRKSARPEQVLLQVETFVNSEETTPADKPQSLLTVTAHRDELAELQRSLHLTLLDTD
ncbi:MAG: cofactor assembly of complex C subunit B [Leptolyngbyaceae cyanobacterium CRU_2_3]|nr:cofactor assembly of complex C subunit B [Leptolyngbyaceae cyanobacterium CRU_2_3]